ncbi:MAG TPA: thiamine-phosphate kinase [Dehalococcoidia bacterium]|nr:thiamine-phosphate kinase [Dehalococcoidia bacterium]
MLVSEVGEFGLIRLLAESFGIAYPPSRDGRQPGLLVGLGDDAAVSPRPDGPVIWTTDTLVAGVHFLPERSSWSEVGWKALAVNLSDIAAMGGVPHLCLVTLLLPAEFCVEDALELYSGLHAAAKEYGVTLAGGDIVRSPVFAVTVALSGLAAVGLLGQSSVLTRSAARPDDIVAVSGTLGDAAGGVRLLQAASEFGTESERRLREAQQRPRPRVSLGREAVRAGIRCAIDVSDGLVQDLRHVATASRVGIRVEANRLPISDALRAAFPAEAAGLAISGGEDYELVLIAPRPAVEALIDSSETPLTAIGEVYAADEPHVAVIDETGREVPLARAGWDHLAPA